MQNQVISETLLDRREEWQNHIIREMQEKLNSHPSGRYLVADYKKSLVVVYGNSQIGKTSLILHMMGILSEYQEEVYSVLRAKQEYGDSSTITAIIYLISPSDSYGMSFSSGDGKEIAFYDDEQMIQNLSSLRDHIEKGDEEERILYIFIPRKYFCEEVLANESFSIMDLPGINSRNELEKAHVDSIVSRYMSLATVKMIVTKGDSIQDLASIEVPEGIDWRAFPNKYFIVVTMAFSQGSVKNYFETEKKDKSFSEYVTEAYAEIPEIIQSNEMEWYPIDIGESYRNLLCSYPKDSKEIISTQKYFTKQIREAIIKRKGNGLHNIIEELKCYSKDYYRVNISKLRDKIAFLESKKQSREAQLKKVKKDKVKYEDEIGEFSKEKINKFRIIENFDLQSLWKSISQNNENFIQTIANNYPMKIKDHELMILDNYLRFVEKTIDLCNAFLKENLWEDIFREMYQEEDSKGIFLKKDSKGAFICRWEEVANLLTQQKLVLTKMFRPKGVRYVVSKVSRTELTTTIANMIEEWMRIVRRNINSDLSTIIVEIKADKEEYFLKGYLLERIKSEELKLPLEIKSLKDKLDKEKESLSNWENKEKSDSDLLDTYFRLAKREYEESKRQLKSEMRRCSIDERLQYLILLGLMEQDYNAIVKGE